LTRGNALATSPGFSQLLDVRRPSDGPRIRSCALGLCGIPSIWRSPTTWQPGGSPRRNRRVRHLALPPGWRVVALREIDGMPHPAHLTQPQQFLWLVILEICPPGEGIFWVGCRLDQRVEYRLAKDRPITDREQESVLVRGQRDSDRCCPWFPVSPQGNGHARGTNQDHRTHWVWRPAAGHQGEVTDIPSRRRYALERTRGRGPCGAPDG
jgi:hypothetical protein